MGANATKDAGTEAISDDAVGIAVTLAHLSAHDASLVQSRFDCLSQSWPGGQQSACAEMTGAVETLAEATAAGNRATDKAVRVTKMARAKLMVLKSYRLDRP